MGAGQHKNTASMKTGTNNISITHNRFVNALDAAKIKANCKDDLKIEPFKRMVGW
jgi:hypothetical protein